MVQPLYEGSTPSPTADDHPERAEKSKQCWVVKLADTPPCLGGGDHGTNAIYGLTTN